MSIATQTGVHPAETMEASSGVSESRLQNGWSLFLASFLALYFELVVIRYLSTEIVLFAYLKNLALIASFFGIGLGMILGQPPKVLKHFFPLIAAALFSLIAFASPLGLTHIPIPSPDYFMWGVLIRRGTTPYWLVLLAMLICFGIILGIMYLVVQFFVVLGGIVGQRLALVQPLPGYGINLAGSLAGIVLFTALSFMGVPPAIWVLVGLLAAVPFFIQERWAIAVFVFLACAMAISQPHTFWSPYYRITLEEVSPPPGWPRPAAYRIEVNHDYHQKMLDLSPEFTARCPDAEPNRSGGPAYELPYEVVRYPGRVLVVGAGTGNDVAAALRHGATHVDAVEIDPYILRLGRTYHPERPYDSQQVTVFVDDARAFFRKTNHKYDLIVFGYLDSHTLLTSFSSIRLDNYVYTLESFREAKNLLSENGTVVLAFGAGNTFVPARLFATLTRAFGAAPRAYYSGYDGPGVVFLEGGRRDAVTLADFPEISKELQSQQSNTVLATDHWPFLYLRSRRIPTPIIVVLGLFLCLSLTLIRRKLALRRLANRQDLHLFFLGAGFMLLETKGVTELSLLFGSTWIVNAVVIAAFLSMGLLANTLVIVRPVSRGFAYGVLFILLLAGMFLPYSLFGSLPVTERVFAAAMLVGLPVFFSGLIFSRSFQDVTQPAQGLGMNLLGAVVGGILENLVMIGGTSILGVLAIVLYGLSAALVSGSFARQATTGFSEAALSQPTTRLIGLVRG